MVKDTNFDEKLKNINKKVILNKTKHVLVENGENVISEKIKLLWTNDSNFFLGRMWFAGNDGFQNMFVYQPASSKLQLKKDNGMNYILRWKSKGVYNFTLFPPHTAFLQSIKLFWYNIAIKFNKDLLVVEQSNYATKI